MTWFDNASMDVKQNLRLFIATVAVNYLMAIAQTPLYAAFEDRNLE